MNPKRYQVYRPKSFARAKFRADLNARDPEQYEGRRWKTTPLYKLLPIET